MPLLGSNIAPVFDDKRQMVGLWMYDPDVVGPVQGVHVFVTLEALWQLDPASLRTVDAALVICAEQKRRVHLAASNRFDNPTGGVEPGEEHEGRPVIVLTTYEFDGLPRGAH